MEVSKHPSSVMVHQPRFQTQTSMVMSLTRQQYKTLMYPLWIIIIQAIRNTDTLAETTTRFDGRNRPTSE